MYKVTLVNDGVETVIHSPYVNGLKLAKGIIKKEINKIDSFNFGFYLNNPAYGKIKPLKTLIRVLNLKTGKYDFEGRVLGPTKNMDSSGIFDESYECEGELGYLHDSQQKHREFRGTPEELFREIIYYHNNQVEEYKRFEPGIVTVTDPNDYIYIYTSAEQDTFETIFDKLINRLGGELRIRKENGVRFLDYIDRIGEDKNTEIRLAKNLISITVDIDPTQIITRLTPLGMRIESEDETATDASPPRLTIESVNGGIPYIDSPELIQEFGIQGRSVIWDDVTDPNILFSKGLDFLKNQKTSYNQYQLSAADLFLIGLDPDNFEEGNTYPVINPVMGINERLRVIGKTIDINNPHRDTLTIGDKFKTLSEYQKDANQYSQKVVELENIIGRQAQTIGSLRNELKTVDDAVKDVKQAIEDMDIEALNQAVLALEQAIQNLQEAIEAIPSYEPATPEKDGLMSASDKAKLDLIQVLESIDLDALKEKLNLISVTEAVDLDGLVQRVEALENEVFPPEQE